MSGEGWEHRMAQRAAERRRRHDEVVRGPKPTRPKPGEFGSCVECWDWRPDGPVWVMLHRPPGYSACRHACHEDDPPMIG